MLTEKRRHSDSIAPTKDLLIAVQRLFRAGLALSVTFGDTSPKGRGFGIPQRFAGGGRRRCSQRERLFIKPKTSATLLRFPKTVLQMFFI